MSVEENLQVQEQQMHPTESSSPVRQIAFGSNVERLMFPMHTAPTRLGIEQGIKGPPHLSPGCYQDDILNIFPGPLSSRPRSNRGWYFGASIGTRQELIKNAGFPGPADYHLRLRRRDEVTEQKNPFGVVCPRFSKHQYHTPNPGPGTYEFGVRQGRHVDYCETFGGARSLKNSVRVKCTKGVADICARCHSRQVGDYYENDKHTLCPACLTRIKSSPKPSTERLVAGYRKVRDCSAIHRHDFLGAEPKIILRAEADQRKLKLKEAYMRQYYSE